MSLRMKSRRRTEIPKTDNRSFACRFIFFEASTRKKNFYNSGKIKRKQNQTHSESEQEIKIQKKKRKNKDQIREENKTKFF